MISAKKLQKKLVSYIKFRELARSIKLVALSKLSGLKKKISTRGIALSAIVPLFNKKHYSTEFEKCLVVPVGVDKSCCGPHNGNIFRKTERLVERLQDASKQVGLFTMGNRTKDYFKKYYSSLLISHVYNFDKEPLSLTASFLITEKMLEKLYDRFYIVFNRYYTPFIQKTSCYELTGINDFYNICLNLSHRRKETAAEDFFSFIYKLDQGTLQGLLDDLYFHSFSMVLLDALQENEYSSLGARVTAMDNSTQNASKMIDVMRLLYNKARQASITNELIEIVSCANFV